MYLMAARKKRRNIHVAVAVFASGILKFDRDWCVDLSGDGRFTLNRALESGGYVLRNAHVVYYCNYSLEEINFPKSEKFFLAWNKRNRTRKLRFMYVFPLTAIGSYIAVYEFHLGRLNVHPGRRFYRHYLTFYSRETRIIHPKRTKKKKKKWSRV